MSSLVAHYVYNPFTGFFKRVYKHLEIAGYMRAAGEMQRLGLIKESKNCTKAAKKLKAELNENLKGWV